MKHTKSLLIWFAVLVLIVGAVQYSSGPGKVRELTFTQFVKNSKHADKVASADFVQDITVRGNNIDGTLANGDAFRTTGDITAFQKDLIDNGVNIRYEREETNTWLFAKPPPR